VGSLRTNFADAESLDEFSVLDDVASPHVGFEAAATTDQEQKAPAAVEIFAMHAKVIGDLCNASLHHGDLNFGGAGIAFFLGVGFDRFFLGTWI